MSDSSTGNGRPKLPLSLLNRERFIDLFYEPDSTDVAAKVALHLHVLRIDGGELALSQMYSELANATLGYVLSRQNMTRLKSDLSRMVEVVNTVQSKFRVPDSRNGEGGELLLYALLEGHLGAPKVLSKMELKTAGNHYVYGADGVHLLEVAEDKFQLIFGESKMYGDRKDRARSSFKRAIQAAFKSIADLRDEEFDFDTWLVESELLKEAYDQDLFDRLVSVLLPTSGGPTRATAFGVLLGYEVDVTEMPLIEMTEDQIESEIRRAAREHVDAEIATINQEIIDRGLAGFHFHIYAVPFLKSVVDGKTRGMEQVRMELAAALKHESKK
jgi:hypothetical protein